MASGFRKPADYMRFLELLTEAEEQRIRREERASVGVQLWVPVVSASSVGAEIVDLDADMRRAAAWLVWAPLRGLPVPPWLLRERLEGWPIEFPGWLPPLRSLVPDPISSDDGGLELVRARQGQSLEIDLEAVGFVLGMLADVPTVFAWVRALYRRLPFRVVWRPAPDTGEPTIDRSFPDRDTIEARRLARRVTIREPDGFSLVWEEFDGGR